MLTSQRGKINSELGGTGSAATFYEPHMKELVRNPKNQIGVHQIGVRRPGCLPERQVKVAVQTVEAQTKPKSNLLAGRMTQVILVTR